MPPGLLLMAFALAGLTLLEGRFPARRDPSQRLLNIAMLLARLIPAVLLTPLVSAAAVQIADRLGVSAITSPAWPPLAATAAYVLAMDLGEYTFHRAQHAIPFLWRMHSLHHSDPCMNATTTDRHWWGDSVIKALTIWPVVAILFRPSVATLGVYGVLATYHYFSHANLRVSFGRLSWLLNSPSYHRTHHSSDPAHHGANFAALLPIFDVILGSYRPAAVFPPTGLERRPETLVQALIWPFLPEPGASPVTEAPTTVSS
jgi:sterol desaturase/sphingolipid hydroxylase (fatty acid hydroxylase superfamily)